MKFFLHNSKWYKNTERKKNPQESAIHMQNTQTSVARAESNRHQIQTKKTYRLIEFESYIIPACVGCVRARTTNPHRWLTECGEQKHCVAIASARATEREKLVNGNEKCSVSIIRGPNVGCSPSSNVLHRPRVSKYTNRHTLCYALICKSVWTTVQEGTRITIHVFRAAQCKKTHYIFIGIRYLQLSHDRYGGSTA